MQTTAMQSTDMQPSGARTITPEIVKALDDAFGPQNFNTCRFDLEPSAPPATEMYVDWLDNLIRLAGKCRATITENTFRDFEAELAEVEVDLLLHLLAIRNDNAVAETLKEMSSAGCQMLRRRKAERARLVRARIKAQEGFFYARLRADAAARER